MNQPTLRAMCQYIKQINIYFCAHFHLTLRGNANMPPTAVEAEKKEQCGFEKNNGAEQGEDRRWVQTLERRVS